MKFKRRKRKSHILTIEEIDGKNPITHVLPSGVAIRFIASEVAQVDAFFAHYKLLHDKINCERFASAIALTSDDRFAKNVSENEGSWIDYYNSKLREQEISKWSLLCIARCKRPKKKIPNKIRHKYKVKSSIKRWKENYIFPVINECLAKKYDQRLGALQ